MCLTITGLHSNGRILEGCLRVAAHHRGGIWVVAKSVQHRLVFLVLEGSNTLKEMNDVFVNTLEKVLGNVML